MENEGQQTKKQVILGWAPPANVYMPSPAMSVLKAYLQNFGYNVCIEYWNLYLRKLQNEFMWSDGTLADEGAEHLLLYYNYLAIKHKDTCAYNRLKVLLKAIKPQYINMSPNFWDEHMHQYAQKFEELLNEIIDKYDFDNILYFGLEVNLYQWVLFEYYRRKNQREKSICSNRCRRHRHQRSGDCLFAKFRTIRYRYVGRRRDSSASFD